MVGRPAILPFMTLTRRLILALALTAGIAPAVAQVPPPVPALPDTERRTTYSISGTACICNVGFALFGDSADYANWVEVFLNGIRVNFNDPTFGWTITSPTGSLGTIPRPITDAVLTFTSAQTGTVQIVGARRPRRASQFNENAGIPARNFNQVLTDIIAQNREIWDKTNDFTGRAILGLPGETLAPLPAAASRASQNAIFDSLGNLTAGTPITGGGVISAAMQPVTSAATLALGRTAFGLGTAATQNTGTSGAAIPFLNGTNVWSGTNTFPSPILTTAEADGVWTTGSSWTLPAFTLNGTVSGGGNQINNVIVGNSTPLAGSFTNVSATGSVLSSSASAGIGYKSGAGGVVTQATNKSTSVTLNTLSGAITMNGAALASGAIVTFVLTDSAINGTDVLVLNHINTGTVGGYTLNAQAQVGSAFINVRNNTAGSLSEAIIIQFAVIKAANN